ncbi:MAG: translation initiation factor IF-3 [bacterium]
MRRSNRRRKFNNIDRKELKINQAIRAPIVSLIDEDGNALGPMETRKAFFIAQEKGYDLVEVYPKANPPVAKLIDYGEYKYKKEKQEQKNKARQKKIDIKGVRLSLRISKHDIDMRSKKAIEFIEEGHKVKVELMLKGREREHRVLAGEIVKKFIIDLGEIAKVEQQIQQQGGLITAIITKK